MTTSRTSALSRTAVIALATGLAAQTFVGHADAQSLDIDVLLEGTTLNDGVPASWHDAGFPYIRGVSDEKQQALVSIGISDGATYQSVLWTLGFDGTVTPVFIPTVLQPGVPAGVTVRTVYPAMNAGGDIQLSCFDDQGPFNFSYAFWRQDRNGNTGYISDSTATLVDSGDRVSWSNDGGVQRSDGTVYTIANKPEHQTGGQLTWAAWHPNGDMTAILDEHTAVDWLPETAEFFSTSSGHAPMPLGNDAWLVRGTYYSDQTIWQGGRSYHPLFITRPGQTAQTVFAIGETLPGLPGGEQVSGLYLRDSGGDHAVIETVSGQGRNVLWNVDAQGTLTRITQENWNAPVPQPGAKFDEFLTFDMNDQGDLLFTAKLSGVPDEMEEAVFLRRQSTGSIRLVVQDGQAMPGFDPLDVGFDTEPMWGPSGDIWFMQSLGQPGAGWWEPDVVNDTALWRDRGAADPQLLVAYSQPVDLNPDPTIDDLRTVTDMQIDAAGDAAIARFQFDGDGSDDTFAIARLTVTTQCAADVNGDGIATPADFNAWILAFNNQTPACDQNNDGLCTPADFNAWIVNFNAGC